MEVMAACRDRVLELYLKGELDHHGAKGLLTKLEREIEASLPSELILDFSGITFMDSAGIAILLRLWQRMEELGGSIHIRDLPEQPGRVFRAAGLARLIPTEPIPERSDA